MKIYAGDNKAKAKIITFESLLIKKLKEANIEMDNGSFDDENHSWVGIVQINKKTPSKVVVNISFKPEEDVIEDVRVYESKIITIIDDENMRQVV